MTSPVLLVAVPWPLDHRSKAIQFSLLVSSRLVIPGPITISDVQHLVHAEGLIRSFPILFLSYVCSISPVVHPPDLL